MLLYLLSSVIVCSTALANGNFSNRAPLQDHRPPFQTEFQAKIVATNTEKSAAQSAAARDYVLGLMDEALKSGKLAGLPCENATAEELLDVYTWEFRHLPLTHNGPNYDNMIEDDSDVFTTMSNHYIQNVFQRYLYGVETSTRLEFQTNITTKYFNFPPFPDPTHPTLREANDRILYVAAEVNKLNTGFYFFGTATYVLNPKIFAQSFISPFDTGLFHFLHEIPFGTADNFYHLIQPNLETYHYNMSSLLNRWYGDRPPVALGMGYYELAVAANVWLPESLLYFIGFYPELWGTLDGDRVREWMTVHKRPVVWSFPSDRLGGGSIIDPVVNNVQFNRHKSVITPEVKDTFKAYWKMSPKPDFKDVFAGVDPVLHFEFPNYYKKQPCVELEYEGSIAQIMGTNELGSCVYWDWTDSPSAWECFNDGTCGQTMRGTFSSEVECVETCAKGPWTCQQNANHRGYAGPLATTCVHDPTGTCTDLNVCEANCDANNKPQH